MKNEASIRSDIDALIHARDEIEAANNAGNSTLFFELGNKYGPIAHRLYRQLDAPSKEPGNYYDKSIKAVLLDPWTILNRMKSFDEDVTPNSLEFWNHSDMVKNLADYFLQTQPL